MPACGSSLPRPEWAQVDQADYVEVASPPRPAPVEFIPPSPRKGAVWVDGSWEYIGSRFGWTAGTWAVVPTGLRRARWLLIRRREDGQLFFAPSTWKDRSGKTVDDSAWIHALGPQARARSRIDGEAVFDDVPVPGTPTPPPPMPIRQGEAPGSAPPGEDLR